MLGANGSHGKPPSFAVEVYEIAGRERGPTRYADASLQQFLEVLRAIDWPMETARSLWAGSGAPGMAAIDNNTGNRFWFAGYNWAHAVVPGGGSTYRETTEYVAGMADVEGQSILKDRAIPSLDLIESLFEEYFYGRISELKRLHQQYPITDVYI